MAADARDLTTVALVEGYLTGVPSSPGTDAFIQGLITSASVAILDRCGLDSLNSVNAYSERYDGSGSRRQFLRNRPIAAVSSLRVVCGSGAITIPASPDAIQPGFVIDQQKNSLAIIGNPSGAYTAGGGGYGYGLSCFPMGIQNVLVSYTAGYATVPPDVQDKATMLVAVNYRRRGWLDQVSQQLQQSGTVSYRSWVWPPEVDEMIKRYGRNAIV